MHTAPGDSDVDLILRITTGWETADVGMSPGSTTSLHLPTSPAGGNQCLRRIQAGAGAGYFPTAPRPGGGKRITQREPGGDLKDGETVIWPSD